MSAAEALPRVLLITGRADIGGGPEHVLQLVDGLAGRCQIFVACPQEAPYWDRYMNRVGSERMLAIPRRRLSLSALWALRRFVARQRIELIHSHGSAASAYSRPVGTLSAVPVVHTHHGLFFVSRPGGLKRRLRLLVERLLERFTSLSIFVSDGDQALARSAGFGFGASRMIRNGVAVPAEIATANRADAPLKIITVNNYSEAKNPDLLFEIIAKLAARPEAAVEVHVYGDGDGRAAFASALRAAGHDRFVRVHGAVPGLREQLPTHDIFLSCSRWEGLPYAVLEAMAAGLPTVLSRVPGHDEILAHGLDDCGYALGDPAEAVDRLLSFQTQDSRQFAGARAQAVVRQHFGAGEMLDRTWAAYCDVLEHPIAEWQPNV
ncbi:glycosyltransferase family 4 protein [uncultured Nevskia sp.]|uniref:glycosyltransferase family 4 protein n=1 Tax=uncultured Nevskia sp. TaxID=228950 RepID=UPI0025DD9C59|nr:glycosyltransferase family 4 protein [uncultured Nevskia sp.]